MADPLRDALGAPTALWSRLARPQQLLVLGLGVLVAVGILLASQRWPAGEYVPLFASLTSEEAGAIVAELRSSKTPYRIGGAGDQILVPAEQAGEVRLRMAARGLPLGGGVGFEVFDKSPFGMSDFGQRLNYQRALQGELSRTIGQLRQVVRARVHLVLPQPSLFTDRDRPASASVFLQLSANARLGADQVRGIVHLVASSVEGLSPDRVTVVDTAGHVLSVGAEAEAAPLSPRRLEVKTAVEEGLERRVQSLLDGALGPGRAMTRVSAQLNLDQVDRTEERFDPTPVVRREVRTVETTTGNTATPVLPPAPPAAGAPAPPAQNSTTTNQGNREAESVDYELTRVVARTLTTPGEIQRLSVAVVLRMNTRGTPKDGKEVREPVPRSADELEKLRTIVMSAVGYTETRGDQVTVVELPFDAAAGEPDRMPGDEAVAPTAVSRWYDPRLVGGAVLMLLIAVVTSVWLGRRAGSRRRAVAEVARTLDAPVADAGADARLPSVPRAPRGVPTLEPDTEPIPELSEEFARIGEQRKTIREKAYKLASTEPDATAQLLRAWMVKRKPGGTPAETPNAG
jgi:flagellar M-ring protein FliF